MRPSNQAEHKRTEDLYRSVVELATDSIITVDMKGVITSSNTAATRILGYSQDELIGKHFSKIGILRAREIPKFSKLFKSALRGELTKPLELSFCRKDGTPILAEVRVGLLKEGGKTIGLQAVSRDITERKQAEEALRESEERQRAQYKGIPVPAYTWQRVGEDFVLVDYNDAAQAITRGNVADFV
ncbi:MAG: PAS domain S-box protein, partial [Anaerolineae bacterium]